VAGLSVEVVFETHATTEDNEAGVASQPARRTICVQRALATSSPS